MQLAYVLHVLAEHALLQGLGAQHVVGHQQELAIVGVQPGVPRAYGVEIRAGPSRLIPRQQRIQHRHEVRLTGTERPVQIGGLGRVTVQRRLDQIEGLVEIAEQPVGDDVILERSLDPLGGDRLIQL